MLVLILLHLVVFWLFAYVPQEHSAATQIISNPLVVSSEIPHALLQSWFGQENLKMYEYMFHQWDFCKSMWSVSRVAY